MSGPSATVARVLEEATEGPPTGEFANHLIAALSTVLRGKIAAYVSTPITTGPALLSWRQGPGRAHPLGGEEHRAFLRRMISQNTDHARPLVAALEADRKAPTIDPTRLGSVPGWRQADYHAFWVRVIEEFVHTVAFADGWQYSTGCVLEFEAAARGALTILDAQLKPISRSRGLALIGGAIGELNSASLDTSTHRVVLERMAEDAEVQ